MGWEVRSGGGGIRANVNGEVKFCEIKKKMFYFILFFFGGGVGSGRRGGVSVGENGEVKFL